MMFSANGLFTGHPDEHLIFSNVLLGLLLRLLYTLVPHANWYCIMLYGSHVLGLAGLLYALFRLGSAKVATAGMLCWFIMFRFRWILLLQFTTSAFAAGIGGVAILLSSLLRPSCPRPALLYASFLITLCFLIRWEAGPPLVLLSFPFLIAPLLLNRFKQRKEMIYAVAAVLAGVLGRGIDQAYYHADAGWRQWLVSNEALTTLIDGPWRTRRGTVQFRDPAKWSENDTDVFVSWMFVDNNVFSVDRMKALADRVPFYGSHEYALSVTKKVLRESIPQLCGTALALLLAIVFTQWWTGLALLGSLACTLAILYYLAYHLKLETRVVHPMLGLIVLAALSYVLVQREENARISRLRAGMLWIFAIGTAVWMAPLLIRFTQENARDNALIRKECEQNYRRFSDKVFISCGPGIHLEYLSPLWDTHLFEGIQLVPTASFIHSPIEAQNHARFGITNLFTDVVDNPKFILVMEPKIIPALTTFYKEHYNQDVVFTRAPGTTFYRLFQVHIKKQLPA